MNHDFKYMTGFGNHFATEAVAGVLPEGRNSPQKPTRGLYPEQLSGSAFTMPRHENLRSWLYRTLPSVVTKSPFRASKLGSMVAGAPLENAVANPNQLRWDPMPEPSKPNDFLEGLHTIVANGDSSGQKGCAVHLYACNQSMEKRAFYNSDGEIMIVPYVGSLLIRTELGVIDIEPEEICVIPRGVKFQVLLQDTLAKGYVCENYGHPFILPNLGPIGANGLANPRDFQVPVAFFEDRDAPFELVTKFGNRFWSCDIPYSPFNVVAWHGNYFPYKYDLRKFNTINTVSYDHPDPSIFTVLTSPSDTPGMANIDFVIFPPRWMVAENTFRPPYFHRNIMSEYMGLIKGVYDAKAEGFVPGGSSLHNCMSAHGPDGATVEAATDAKLVPHRYEATLAFMFESRYPFVPTPWSMTPDFLQEDYFACWQGIKKRF